MSTKARNESRSGSRKKEFFGKDRATPKSRFNFNQKFRENTSNSDQTVEVPPWEIALQAQRQRHKELERVMDAEVSRCDEKTAVIPGYVYDAPSARYYKPSGPDTNQASFLGHDKLNEFNSKSIHLHLRILDMLQNQRNSCHRISRTERMQLSVFHLHLQHYHLLFDDNNGFSASPEYSNPILSSNEMYTLIGGRNQVVMSTDKTHLEAFHAGQHMLSFKDLTHAVLGPCSNMTSATVAVARRVNLCDSLLATAHEGGVGAVVTSLRVPGALSSLLWSAHDRIHCCVEGESSCDFLVVDHGLDNLRIISQCPLSHMGVALCGTRNCYLKYCGLRNGSTILVDEREPVIQQNFRRNRERRHAVVAKARACIDHIYAKQDDRSIIVQDVSQCIQLWDIRQTQTPVCIIAHGREDSSVKKLGFWVPQDEANVIVVDKSLCGLEVRSLSLDNTVIATIPNQVSCVLRNHRILRISTNGYNNAVDNEFGRMERCLRVVSEALEFTENGNRRCVVLQKLADKRSNDDLHETNFNSLQLV
jgi:hypothetical protein